MNIFKNIFPHFHNLHFDKDFDAKNVRAKIEKERSKLNVSKDYLKDNGININYKNLENVPEGRFTVYRDDFRMESCFISAKNSDELIVVFAGARSRGKAKVANLPQLQMWSWAYSLGSNYLYIEDPMYYKYDMLTQGWYYSGKGDICRKYVADLIKKIASIKNITNDKIKLYGLSAGGTGAIAIAKYIDGCSVISINPQINFKDYPYSKEYEKITGIDITSQSSKGKTNDVMRHINTTNSSYVLMINAYSISDVNWHLQYLADYFKFTPKLGLNIISKNFVIYIYNAVGFPDAHNSFPSKTFLPVLLWLSNLLQNNPDDLQKYEQLFLLFNEFYFEEYNYKEKLLQKINNQTSESELALPNFENSKKKCAVVFRCTANHAFTAANMIAGIERCSPNLTTDYVLFTDDKNDERLNQVKEVANFYGKGAVIIEYDYSKISYLHNTNNNHSFLNRYPLIVFSLFEIFNLLDFYENVIALDTDMVVVGPIDDILNIKSSFASRPARFLKDLLPNYTGNGKSSNAGFTYINDKLPNYNKLTNRCYKILDEIKDTVKNTIEECVFGLLLEELKIKPSDEYLKYNLALTTNHSNDILMNASIIHIASTRKLWEEDEILEVFPEYMRDIYKVREITKNKYDNISNKKLYLPNIKRFFHYKFNAQMFKYISSQINKNLTVNIPSVIHNHLGFSDLKIPAYIRVVFDSRWSFVGKDFNDSCNLNKINEFKVQIVIGKKYLNNNLNKKLFTDTDIQEENERIVYSKTVKKDKIAETINKFYDNSLLLFADLKNM